MLLLFTACNKNILVKEYIEVTLDDNSKDTMLNFYWNYFEMDPYKLEWLYKQNEINPKQVLTHKIVKTEKIRIAK
jgi:hypothetical protein